MDRFPADSATQLDTPATLQNAYRGKRVLVLGGDGFLGFHTTRALLRLHAEVTVLTRRQESLHSAEHCRIVQSDLTDDRSIKEALDGQEIVFYLAGSTGGVDSNRDPYQNLIADCAPHLRVIQRAAEEVTPPLVVFCSTRTVYGRPQSLPVSEAHPLAPLSIYAVHKATLESYLPILHRTHGLRYTVFRLSNPYGPYPWQEGKTYGVINSFIQKAHRGEPITIYGDGAQIRDYIYVDDVVSTFVHAAVSPNCEQEVFNLGGPEPISIREAAATIKRLNPKLSIGFSDWPREHQAIETGDYYTDLTKVRQALGPTITTTFAEGVEATLRSYDGLLKLPHVTQHRKSPPGLADLNRSFWEGKRVLVTGASGFLGAHLAKRLRQRGALVGAIHRRELAPWLARDPGVWSLPFDLADDKESVGRVFKEFRPDYVYHFASAPDGSETEQSISHRMQCNLVGTMNLLFGARRFPVQRFVIGDSCKVFGNGAVPHRESSPTIPDSSYAASKLAAWQYCRVFMKAFGVPIAALRPTLIFGPGEISNLFVYLFRCLREGCCEISLAGGQQTRDPIFINDAIHAYLRTVERFDSMAGRAIPIGGGQEQSVADLARLFLENAGRSIPVLEHPEKLRPSEMLRSFCDNSEASRLLGWSPVTTRQESLRQTFLYHQAFECGDGDAFLEEWFELDMTVTPPSAAVSDARPNG